MLDRKIEFFLSVADIGSFRGAAKQLFMTQPSLSQQINLLEQSVGAKLFIRSSKGVKLTRAGQSFYDDAKEMLYKSNAALRKLENVVSESKGVLRIGAGKNHRDLLAADVCYEFANRYPEIGQTFITMSALDLPQAIASGTIDVSEFWESPILRETGCKWVPVLTKEICCAVPTRHRLAQQEVVSLQDLRGERIALNKLGQFDCTDRIRAVIQSSCEAIELVDADEDKPIEHYALNNCLAVVPSPYPYENAYFELRPLEINETINIGLAYSQFASETTLDFIALAKELHS